MKKLDIFLLLVFILLTRSSYAAVIASDPLENTSTVFTVAGGTYYSGNSAAADRPATSPFYSQGSYSYGKSNGTATLTSSAINTTAYTGIQMTLRAASFSITSAANGADAGDYIRVEISPDGGTTYYNTEEVIGNSNAYWSYTGGTGNASTAYDGNVTTVQFQPGGGGNRTADGYSTMTITNIPAVASLKIRITLLNNSANERWVVDDFQLTGTASAGVTAGFDASSGSVTENAGPYNIGVTVNTAPASDMVLRVSDAGTGTASPITDYTFSATDLTFPAIGTYPMTLYAPVTILNDGIPETNKYRNFSLSHISGPVPVFGTIAHQMTIVDDDVLEGVVLNEFSQGAGSAAYLELVVIGVPGTTVDLRGWIIDDNSGIFSGGYGTQLGIADGHIKFSNICTWEKVPVGSIIVIYANDQSGGTPAINDKITSLGLADDPTDANLDYVYVVGVNFYNGSCASATANSYFSSDCSLPSNSSYDVYTPATYSNPDMGTVQFRNSGDAVQLRDQSGTYFMGLSYGSKGAGSTCAGCAISAANHPDFGTYGANSLYFSGTSNVTYSFQNTNSDDYRNATNWTKTTSSSPNALETPGTWNSTNNQTWILSLRANFDIVTDDQNYTCQLRQFESRYYLDAIDKIIFYIKNNANVDQGDLTAETYYYNSATVGRGFENDFIAPSPVLFVEKTWIGTPSLTSASTNYKIRFYVNNTELQNYCDYVNDKLNTYYNLPPGTINYTPATITPKLYLYRTAGSERAWSAVSSINVEKVIPSSGAYGSYTYFEYDGFLAFSGYALGNEIQPNGTNNTLPVELMSFTGNCVDDNMALINWSTASEMNSKEFILERSYDGVHFSQIRTVPAAGNSSQPRSYTVVDSSVTSNENYYRLVEVDNNGKQTIHAIILVKCKEVNGSQIYYTPSDGITVQFNASKDKDIQFNVYEVSGKLLYHENKTVTKGYSKFALRLCKNLADGIYIIQTVDGSHISADKILVH